MARLLRYVSAQLTVPEGALVVHATRQSLARHSSFLCNTMLARHALVARPVVTRRSATKAAARVSAVVQASADRPVWLPGSAPPAHLDGRCVPLRTG